MTDKELLEFLEGQYEEIMNQLRSGQPVLSSIAPNDLKRIIRQVKRVQKLEKELLFTQQSLYNANQQNKQYRTALDNIIKDYVSNNADKHTAYQHAKKAREGGQ